MKTRLVVLIGAISLSTLCFAKADGSWLKKVPEADRSRTNPYAGDPSAVAAGKNLFEANCAHCHGKNAEGKGSRPNLHSDRLRNASDGEISWLLKNGSVFKGMPGWGGLPEQERWQLVAFIRSMNTNSTEGRR